MRSGELPRANGSGLVGFGARSTVCARRSLSDKSARGDTLGVVISSRGCTKTNRARSRSRSRSCSSFGARLLLDRLLPLLHHLAHERQARPEQDRDQDERVDVDGNQHDFPPRKWLRDPRRVGTIVVEVEVHQGLNDYSSSAARLAARGSASSIWLAVQLNPASTRRAALSSSQQCRDRRSRRSKGRL